MASEPQQIGFQYGGKQFPVYIGADGKFYALDREGHLPGKHGALPGASHAVIQQAEELHANASGLAGLGADTTSILAKGLVPTALSFVPVVGPILGPVAGALASIAGTLFGGNDPTPAGDLVSTIVSMRTTIRDLRNAIAGSTVDALPPPAQGYKHYEEAGGNSQALAIVLEYFPSNRSVQDNNHWQCDWSNVNCPGCGNFRKCMYATINYMKSQGQALQNQYSQMQQRQQIQQAVQAAISPSQASIPLPPMQPLMPPINPAPGGANLIPASYSPTPQMITTSYTGPTGPSGTPYYSTTDTPYVAPATNPLLEGYMPFLLFGGGILVLILATKRK